MMVELALEGAKTPELAVRLCLVRDGVSFVEGMVRVVEQAGSHESVYEVGEESRLRT